MEIRSFDELATYLRNFSTWTGDTSTFDFGGAAHLLGACLDSIRSRALDAELEELAEYLDEEQIAFLVRIAALVRR